MRLEESSIVLLMAMLCQMVKADLEYTCTADEYRNPFTEHCVFQLLDFIIARCSPSKSVGIIAGTRQIFLDVQEANALLNYPIGNYQSGMPCECCIHRCSITELEQYCEPLNGFAPPLRVRRSVQRRRRNQHFKVTDIDEIYNAINASVMGPLAPRIGQLSIEKFDQVRKIKSWKLENIENKVLVRYNLVSERNAKASVNRSQPLSKDSQGREEPANASKSRVLCDTNKESQQLSSHPRRHKSCL
ncbi:uncharacterized protein [Watersipora subatra]